MSGQQLLREQLQALHGAILRERTCARNLAMDEMLEATRCKEELLQTLGPLDEVAVTADHEIRQLAATIREENRRNAYLFWVTLNWIRQSMEFFGKQTTPAVYSASGATVRSRGGGRLLSGKV